MIKDKACPNFRGLNVTEHAAECESVAIISVLFLLASENKHYLQVYLDYCDYKIVGKQMIGYLDDNLFESHEN